MKLFIYEYACAQYESTSLPASVRVEGRLMFDAVMEDARGLKEGVEVITLETSKRSGQTEREAFLEAAGRADHALVIAPEFDGILEERARWVLEAGCRLLGPMPEAIRLTADKWELYRRWKERGVPTPQTWIDVPVECEGKCVVKHRYGTGSLGLAWWKSSTSVPEDYLIQRFVEGIPASMALLISGDGDVTPLLPAMQMINERFEYEGGAFLDVEQFGDRLRRVAALAVEGIAGLQGYVGVDAILGRAENGSEDVVLEINPRLTTSYLGYRKACSSNLVKAMLDAITGVTKVPLVWGTCRESWQIGNKA